MIRIQALTDIHETLTYLMDKLNWPISQDRPAVDPYEVNWEYYPEDLGLKDEDFAQIETLQQMRPLTEDQEWAVFFVEFNSKKMQITVLRKILGALIYNKRNTDHKTWDKENLLFVCFWGEGEHRTIGFVHFNQSVKGLPTLKALYFEPHYESADKLLQYEELLSHLYWKHHEKCEEWTEEWKKAFTTEYGQVIRDTKRLTTELAHSAQRIRQQILDVLEIENNDGYVHKLLKKFKDSLVHDLDEKSFADMYAQTICYGLFSARCLSVGKPASDSQPELKFEPFDPLKDIDNIPDTNPFLRKLLREGLDSQKGNVKKSIPFDELELYTIIDLLDNTDIESIVNEFNRQTKMGKEDPVIHFYEDFLTEYDKETKIDRGVFYTPLPVVNFIVNSVDQILKTEFGLKDGLACDEQILVPFSPGKGKPKYNKFVYKVQVLDPATGTGTFLRQAILKIKDNFDQKNKGNPNAAAAWNKYVSDCMLWRLNGFELMMAPYAVAHMKLAMALKATGYNFAENRRLKVFLTNSLEKAGDTSGHPSLFDEDAIAVEATKANIVKKESNINVVIGNPPYSGISSNNNAWINGLIDTYRTVNGKPLGEKKVWFNDDYCKFIRVAQNIIDNNGKGILAFINPNGLIDNLSFKGMRWSLLSSFDKIYILDLHGNPMKKEVSKDGGKDENVFDITQSVCINIYIKTSENRKKLADVYYSDILGLRKSKFDFLNKNSIDSIVWKKVLPSEPNYMFRPINIDIQSKYYNSTFSIKDALIIDVTGVVTMGDSFALAKTPKHLENNILGVINNNYTEEELTKKYQLGKNYSEFVLKNKTKLRFDKQKIFKYHYRPFDFNYIYYDSKIIWRDRYEVMRHMLKPNLGFIVSRQAITDNWSHVLVSEYMVDGRIIYSNKGIASFFPLYLYEEGFENSRPNLNRQIAAKIVEIIGMKLKPLDFIDYIYAVLHIPSYRTKYKEFLKIDFPRIPYPKSKDQFFTLAKMGGELRQLHLMKSPIMDKTPVKFFGNPISSDEVTTRKWENGKVWINKSEYFDGVPESAWNFYIGGYQVADKWLKDRKGRQLSVEEIKHYCRIIKILIETERIMGELDKIE